MKNKKTYTVQEATILLERYCIYQDRCHKEVETKLYKIGMIKDAQELIILHLLQNDFLNEERFAKSYARGKFNQKKWGKIKIVSELKWKGISSYNIKTALTEIDAMDYLEALKALAFKKNTTIKGANSFTKRKKLSSFLIGKGFEFDLILKVIKDLYE